MALVAGALWAWSRGSPVLTGLLIGLGTAAKLYPLFLLGGILVICVRRASATPSSSRSPARRSSPGCVANVPAYLTGPEQWKVFWRFNDDRAADLGSVWLMMQQAGDVVFSADTINNVSLLFFGAVVRRRRRARAWPPRRRRGSPSSGFLVVAGFLLINKVYSPQYVLWLLPLAVLARPRWRDLLIWQAGEIFYFASVWWYLDGDLAPAVGGDAGTYWVAIVLRILAELYLVAVVVRDILRPRYDPVHTSDQLIRMRSNTVAV